MYRSHRNFAQNALLFVVLWTIDLMPLIFLIVKGSASILHEIKKNDLDQQFQEFALLKTMSIFMC